MASIKIIHLFILVFCEWSLGDRTFRQAKSFCERDTMFYCPSGECIIENKICDGDDDCQDGSDESPAACDCGRVINHVSRDDKEVHDVVLGNHPWHVGVYKHKSIFHRHTLLCSGALIYPDIVLTSAFCVYDTSSYLAYEASSIIVAVGKLKRDLSVQENREQNFNVTHIIMLPGFQAGAMLYPNNLAILKLDRKIQNDLYVRPICFWKQKLLPSEIKAVTITGWGLEAEKNFAPNLKEAKVSYSDGISCKRRYKKAEITRLLKYDQFCIFFGEGVGIKNDDVGGPVSFYYQGIHYLYGILSVRIQDYKEFGIATGIFKHMNWLYNISNTLRKEAVCDIESHFHCSTGCISETKVCDGRRDCPDGSDESPVECIAGGRKFQNLTNGCEINFPNAQYEMKHCSSQNCPTHFIAAHTSVFDIKCKPNYGFETKEETQMVSICLNTTWNPTVPKCIKLCPGFKNEFKSLTITCLHDSKNVACNSYMYPNTSISSVCKPQYKIKDSPTFVSKSECFPGGYIIPSLSACIPICGVSENGSITTLISGGNATKLGKFPWHVGIYWKNDHGNTWQYRCGGSIIGANKILTAAHCLVVAEIPKKPEHIQVISGKYYSDWEVHDQYEQRVQAFKVIPHGNYDGARKRYFQDIGVIILKEDLKFDSFTMPICLDLDSKMGGIVNNQVGHVVGWGSEKPNKRERSRILKETHLKYIDYKTCSDMFNRTNFRNSLYPDKFCVLYVNGTGTESGDSGGGFTFVHNDLHYIYGVVSLKPTETNDFAAFTNISYSDHIGWLKNILNDY